MNNKERLGRLEDLENKLNVLIQEVIEVGKIFKKTEATIEVINNLRNFSINKRKSEIFKLFY